MPQYTVQHPDMQFAGEIVGVKFADGTAAVDTEAGGQAAYAYFQRAGYGLTPIEAPTADSRGTRAAGKTTRKTTTDEGDQS